MGLKSRSHSLKKKGGKYHYTQKLHEYHKKIHGGRIQHVRRYGGKRFSKKGHRSFNCGRSLKKKKGGYSQYQNNLPMTPSYSVGGPLSASDLGLANPPPIQVLSNCVDNYNHYTNKGFPSRGH
jgi:hypothetical protein